MAEQNLMGNTLSNVDQFDGNEVHLFVDKNADYYIEKWEGSRNPRKHAGWNWAAFFAGIFWMGYRKMYSTILILVTISLAINIVLLFVNPEFIRPINSLLSFIIGLFGNAFYYNHMRKEIRKIKSSSKSEDADVYFSKCGGASWAGVGVTFLIFIVYVTVFALLKLTIGK
jgi:hypothetical protein